MNVSLTPELDRYVKQKVESGLYNNASEVVREALRMLIERDRFRALSEAELRAEIEKGRADIRSGRISTATAEDVLNAANREQG